MNRTLPSHVKAYAKSAEFNAQTVPDKFLSQHDLKAGTWGCINVMEGELTYFTDEDDAPLAILRGGDKWVICPEERHYVKLSADAVFFVEFFK